MSVILNLVLRMAVEHGVSALNRRGPNLGLRLAAARLRMCCKSVTKRTTGGKLQGARQGWVQLGGWYWRTRGSRFSPQWGEDRV